MTSARNYFADRCSLEVESKRGTDRVDLRAADPRRYLVRVFRGGFDLLFHVAAGRFDS